MGKASLAVACGTLRDVVVERRACPKDVVLGVHRLNQALAKARTFAEAEDLVTSTLLREEGASGTRALDANSSVFLQILVDVVVTGKPEAYPILCLLDTLSHFDRPRFWLARAQVPAILKAVSKGRVEEETAELATTIVRTMEGS